jgi:hypothetical protein
MNKRLIDEFLFNKVVNIEGATELWAYFDDMVVHFFSMEEFQKWLEDKNRIKIWKSLNIGKTGILDIS